MKENYEEVKKSVYAGMSIFNSIKDYTLIMGNEELTLEDKKYLSLYLGIINTKNRISLYLKEKEIKFKIDFKYHYKLLNQDEYLKVYNEYFVDELKEISFSSIEENFNFLLSKKIIKEYNKCNGYYVCKTINDMNKQLIKTIN